jgi:hypothetical protein
LRLCVRMTFGNRVHGLVSSFDMTAVGALRIIVRLLAIGVILISVTTLGGCSFSEGISPYITDPARYSAYHCNDLIERLKYLIAREKELRDLMDKASEGPGGAVIGALSYRGELEKVVGDQKVLKRTAADKKCEVDPSIFQSDQTIR